METLGKHNGHRPAITQASMDMSKAYQAGVAESCRHAQVVFDNAGLLQAVKALAGAK